MIGSVDVGREEFSALILPDSLVITISWCSSCEEGGRGKIVECVDNNKTRRRCVWGATKQLCVCLCAWFHLRITRRISSSGKKKTFSFKKNKKDDFLLFFFLFSISIATIHLFVGNDGRALIIPWLLFNWNDFHPKRKKTTQINKLLFSVSYFHAGCRDFFFFCFSLLIYFHPSIAHLNIPWREKKGEGGEILRFRTTTK